MQDNNTLVGFALLIVAAICAAFMPWGALNVAVDTPVLDGASLPVTVSAFGGSIHLPRLIVSNWLATVLVVCGAALGMTNAKGITTFSRGVAAAPLLLAAGHCLLIAYLLMRSQAEPHMTPEEAAFQLLTSHRNPNALGIGLIVTLLAAVWGAFMLIRVSTQAIREYTAPGQSRIWITLTAYHLAAASCLLVMIGFILQEVPYYGQRFGESVLGIVLVINIAAIFLIESLALALQRRNRWAWFGALIVSLFLLYPFGSLGYFIGPVAFVFGLLAVVCAYWGLLAPGTLAEFRPFRLRRKGSPE